MPSIVLDSSPELAGRRPAVLALIGAFWPGHEAAGPNQSLASLARALGAEFEFKIVARDRPFGASQPAAPAGLWIDRGIASFIYCSVSTLGAKGLGKILRSTQYDILMMNGFFDWEFTIPTLLLRRMKLVPRKPAILSTRGEFGAGALNLKSNRKMAYVRIAHWLGLLDDIWLHATGPTEADNISSAFPWSRGLFVAPNVSTLYELKNPPLNNFSVNCRIIFLGRIARVKNLHIALMVLQTVKSSITFDIFGPISDTNYWKECERLIADLPDHIAVRQMGVISNSAVAETMANYDLLFLPTAGENYGHAIFEALACGVPVLISDQTPWRDLQKKNAGWDLPLDKLQKYSETIDKFSTLSVDAREKIRQGARTVAEEWVKNGDAVGKSRTMLWEALVQPKNYTAVPGNPRP